ncbi:MAG: ribosomal RNA small subunit methyltransferase A [Alphaproteobacteria bacterium]|nr:ribosomal RNA small subunit methyltransferase A [Alphaproteobacteria bacterium]
MSAGLWETLPSVRDMLAQYGITPSKKFGQNFLFDRNITDKIVRAASVPVGTHVIEVGPGPGALTRSLLDAGYDVTAFEIDRNIFPLLEDMAKKESRFHPVLQDAMKTDLAAIPAPRAVVANLPYNVGTNLVIGWLQKIHADPSFMTSITVMLQKEVAERFTAQPRTPEYGRASILAQWLCHAEILFEVPKEVFFPQPKVTSAILRLIPRKERAYNPPLKLVEDITRDAFNQRRKMIKAGLKNHVGYFEVAGIDAQLRPEAIPVDLYLKLAETVSNDKPA